MKTIERHLLTLYLLCIFTFNIYYFYWVFETSKHMEEEKPTPGMVVFLGIITIGIYLVYWNFKTAKEIYNYAQWEGYKGISDQSVLCLICSLIPFGGWLISMGLIQTNINTLHFLESRKKLSVSGE
ncbi:DUF4234 domain-containing protein [Halalkalibacter hemicellulosilyticus]|nr:DUF4234 domain-containing protein [Halalkalibacter hemicellulosilyticus]